MTKTVTAVVEKCPDTNLYVGHVRGLSGAHSQAKALDELKENLREVTSLLLEDGVSPIALRQIPTVSGSRSSGC